MSPPSREEPLPSSSTASAVACYRRQAGKSCDDDKAWRPYMLSFTGCVYAYTLHEDDSTTRHVDDE